MNIPDSDLPTSALWEAVMLDDRERFRSILADQGPRGVAALRDYDRSMADLDSGVDRARAVWHSLSPVQRRTLADLAANGRRAHRVQIGTLRALNRRGLMDDLGLTEKGRFVLSKGA